MEKPKLTIDKIAYLEDLAKRYHAKEISDSRVVFLSILMQMTATERAKFFETLNINPNNTDGHHEKEG